MFSRSLKVAVLYRARKQAAPEHGSRNCCKYGAAAIFILSSLFTLYAAWMRR
jgi:hypothetical protein